MFFNNLKNKENKKYKKIYNVIITIFVLIFFHQYEIHRCNSLDKTMIKIKQFENSYSKSFVNNFFMKTDIEESIKYREINENNILIDHYIYQGNEEPDISVIITVYNQANCFYKVLRSVQNQSLKNIEIIIIDDCSLDNTTEVIENYMKEDKRIKYLKNESNNGKIKSRSDGVRMAKGKYITIIDGDDALSHENILFNIILFIKIISFEIYFLKYKNK